MIHGKEIKSRTLLKEVLAKYFGGFLPDADGKKPLVAYCSSMGPAELLKSFGFEVFYPENHGAMLGAARLAGRYIPLANAAGYSPDVCSYLTSDIGALAAGETPLSKGFGLAGVPSPDILVFNTNQCRDIKDWFAHYQRKFGVPMVGVHSPLKVGEVTKEIVDGLVLQYKALIPELERVSKKKFDLDYFREVVRLSAQCAGLWNGILSTAKSKPAPLTFFDGTIHMAPAVVLRGTRVAVDYYGVLLEEMRQRVVAGIGAVPKERHRLFWDGMPVWGKLRELSDFLAGLDASVVASTYCSSWVFDSMDPAEPFESTARAYIELMNSRSDDVKEVMLAKLLEEFEVDGVIYHEAKTCPHNSNTRYGLPDRLKLATKIPYAVIYGDLNDLRCYSEEQAKTSIEAFLERLPARKGEA